MTQQASSAPGVIRWGHSGVDVLLRAEPDSPVCLDALTTDGTAEPRRLRLPLVELALNLEGSVGVSPSTPHRQHAATQRLRYVDHRTARQHSSDLLWIDQRDPVTGVSVSSRLEHFHDAGVIRSSTSLANHGTEEVLVEFVSSAIVPLPHTPSAKLRWAYNTWTAEARWHEAGLPGLGVVDIGPQNRPSHSRSRLAFGSQGSWSTGDYLPMGAFEDADSGRMWLWQIEHNGAWHWELDGYGDDLCVVLSGPTDAEHQWRFVLAPGETFDSVPVAVGVGEQGFEAALGGLTTYRRAIRRPNQDNEKLPVIFNDYMNCLAGDPSEQVLPPLIDAAAEVGAEYFVIDAGWYADDGGWWETVGQWRPSQQRFPSGLTAMLDRIRAAGMVPGLWVEPEVIGVRSPALRELPTEALFHRHGYPVVENGRYQLDFRHPAARAHLDEVVDRLVGDYGVGYLKFDYNINVGAGTDLDASSPGAGLLGHNRAFLNWLDAVFDRYPALVIENCSSGGMRYDYAQLTRMNLQSTSDQTDPLRTTAIAAAAATACTPEQAAVWAYPQPWYSDPLNDLTMVNALLGRIHLSGRIDRMDQRQRDRVAEAVAVYKAIRARIPNSRPRWPWGTPGWDDQWIACALDDDDVTIVAVWRRGGPATASLPLTHLTGDVQQVELLYPSGSGTTATWQADHATLTVTLPEQPSAQLLLLRGD